MSIDFNQVITAEQKLAEAQQAALALAHASRRAAYVAESDPLRFSAKYDAMKAGTEPDYTAWVNSVAAIKERFPLPVNVQGVGLVED